MSKYKCIAVDQYETWLTVGKIYDGEITVSPKEFSGGIWLYIKRADDGFSCYTRVAQFMRYDGEAQGIGV